MKQRITSQQLAELPLDALQKWLDWCSFRSYPQKAGIGEMIEFLIKYNKLEIDHDETAGVHKYWIEFSYFQDTPYRLPEPCDALWEATKEVLMRGGERQ